MISKYIERCKIVKEFTEDQLSHYFGYVEKKTCHHIDTFYYAVYLNEPDDIMDIQDSPELLPNNLLAFLDTLRAMKLEVRRNGGLIEGLAGMDFADKVFSFYEFCLSQNECFDIFIASKLPNKDTPRIVIQVRSRFLVLEGIKKACEQSLSFLRDFLKPFKLVPLDVRENRIDYAFHTNLIHNLQSKLKYEYLRKHLKSSLRKWNEFGDTSDDFTIDTLNLGRRSSNNIFFRMYNKSREVVEKGYKAFFIEYWFQKKMISRFDKYVYEEAYKLRSYRTGCLYGRLKWYIEFGTNEKFKEECKQLIETCYIDSNNLSFIEEKINGYIPEPTLIVNVEYQTKRRFYVSLEEWLGFVELDKKQLPFTKGKRKKKSLVIEPNGFDPLLKRIFTIFANAPSIIDYLTGYGNCVCFARDRKKGKKEFVAADESDDFYCSWWKRLRGTKIDYAEDGTFEVYRKYDAGMDIKRSAGIFQNNVARLGILTSLDTEERSFECDLVDSLCVLNDNDFVHTDNNKLSDSLTSSFKETCQKIEPGEYQARRKRKARQLKPIIEKLKPVEPEKESI
ncbi:MAG: hypothetical protein IKB02_04830 [Clostridia bacterium]|nr:hypothetical protein [Clostridia bacterium]